MSSRTIAATTMAIALCGSAFGATEIGHWTFDEGTGTTAADSVGTNDGTLDAAMDPATAWVSGAVGGGMALEFDGTDDVVDTGANATDLGIDGDATRAIALWCYTRSFNGGGLFCVGDSNDSEQFCLRTLGTAGQWRIQYYGNDRDFTAPETDNGWAHFALVHVEGQGSRLYLNGELILFWAGRTIATSAADTLKFGIYESGGNSYYDGIIDEVHLYSSNLTDAEVFALASLGSPVAVAMTASDPDEGDTTLGDGDRIMVRFSGDTDESVSGARTGAQMDAQFPISGGVSWGTTSAFNLSWLKPHVLAIDITTAGDCALDIGDTIAVAVGAGVQDPAPSSGAISSSAQLLGDWGLGSVPAVGGTTQWVVWDDRLTADPAPVRSTLKPRAFDDEYSKTTLEGTQGYKDYYNSRLRGWITPDETGAHTFQLTADDEAELFLGLDDSPRSMLQIASLTTYKPFDFSDPAVSAPVALQAGVRYYIEVTHVEHGGGDHVRVGWTRPSAATEQPIAATNISAWRELLEVESIVASDPDDGDGVIGAGDKLTISFTQNANQPGALTGARTGTEMDALFAVSGGHTFGGGSDSYTLSWPSPRSLAVTFDTHVAADIAIGDYLTPRGGADLRMETITDGAPCTQTVAVSGTWGLDYPTSLVAHWKLDEASGATAVDETGNHDAAISGNVTYSADGIFGTALEFDGVDAFVEASGLGLGTTGARSITGWVKASSVVQPNWVNVFGFCDDNDGANTYFDLEANDNPEYTVHAVTWAREIINIDTNWHFFALTFDGTDTVNAYVDGALDGSYTNTDLAIVDAFRIARRVDKYFSGTVDDVRVFNTVLNADAVRGMYEMLPPKVSSVLADDPDNADVVCSAGDVLTITFDAEMNQSATVTGDLSGANMDAYFALDNGHTWGDAAIAFTGAWSGPRTLVLTAVDTANATAAAGDVITIGTGANIGDANGNHTPMTLVCPAIAGDFGLTPQETLILHYTFDDVAGTSAVDSSGNGYDGPLFGMALPDASTTGRIGGAFAFDGVDDTIERENLAGTATIDEFSIMVWVNPDDTATDLDDGDPIVWQNSGDEGFKFAWNWDSTESPGGRFGLRTTGALVWTPFSYTNGTWYHVVAMYDKVAGEVRIYVDGVEAASAPMTFMPNDSADFSVCSRSNNRKFLAATVDDLRIYGRSLPASFVQTIYQAMQVTIAASTPDATENVSTPVDGVFTLTRTASDIATAPAIVVRLDITGTALDPNDATPDYTLADSTGTLAHDTGTTWTLTLPAGDATATITVTPVDDTVPEAQDTVIVTVLAGDDYIAGTPGTDTVTITDDDVPSAFDITTPADDATQVAIPVDFTWTRDPATLAATYTLIIATDAALTDVVYTNDAIADPADASTTVTQQVTAADGLLTDTRYYWTVSAVNAAATVAATSGTVEFWTTDTIAPTVQSIEPTGTVDVDSTVVIIFTEPVDFTTVATAFDITAGGVSVPGTWTPDLVTEDTITFAPTGEFAFDTTYTVTIVAANLTDTIGGNPLDDGADYTHTFSTWAELTGVGTGDGCTPSSRGAPAGAVLLSIAIVLVLTRRRAVTCARISSGLAAALALSLCVIGCGAGETRFAPAGRTHLAPRSFASLSLYDYGTYGTPSKKNSGDSQLKLAPRGGLVMFLGAEDDVDPRITLGAFARAMEDDSKRVELAFDITPSFAEADRVNLYGTITGDYVGFIGDGLLYWKAGGGVVLEKRGEANYFLGVLEGGIGLWLAVGEESAAVLNALVQIPLGDANPAAMFALTGGYEF